MASERWQQVEALYQAALDRDAAGRTRFLEERCGDDWALRQEIESLLRHGAASHAFFDAPAVELAVLGEEQSPVGTRLGSYRITELLGAGGMGRIYRAHDERLGRFVAIKILDDRFSARFEREARAVAALNHPNVCTLYDVGPNYLVMELVEGESLATRLQRGPLDPLLVLRFGTQIADALSAAHAKGIVHRDLKPENVLITGDQVKLVDFGVALIRSAAEASDLASSFPSPIVTQPGSVLGTLAYMSPEQVRGEGTDARSDLFSLGAVLYEAATGTRAFARGSAAETMAAILKEDPPALESDPELDRIIRWCIVKDADQRAQTAIDVAAALRAVHATSDTAARGHARSTAGQLFPSGVPSPTPSDAQLATMLVTRRRAVIGMAAAAVVLLAFGVYTALRPRGRPAAIPLEDLQIVQLTTNGRAERPAISPDGKYVAYIQHERDTYSLRIRQITTGSDVEIVGAERGVRLEAVTVTPDGNFVDFVRGGDDLARALWRVPFLGGRPRRLIGGVDSPVGWSRNGQHMAFVRHMPASSVSHVVIADSDGTHERVLATRRGLALFLSLNIYPQPNLPPAWSLDDRLLAVLAWNGTDEQVAVFDVAKSSARDIPVKGRATGLEWLDTESFVLTNSLEEGAASQLLRLSYPDGRMSRLSNDPNSYHGASVTADGTSVVTARSETRVSVWVGDAMGSKGTEAISPAPAPPEINRMIAWAEDRLLYASSGNGNLSISRIVPANGPPEEIVPGGAMPATTWDRQSIVFLNVKAQSIWKADSDGRQAVELVSKAYLPIDLIVTPDRHVVFLSAQSGVQAPWIVSLDGGSPKQVAHVFAAVGSLDVSPDGGSLVFRSRDEQHRPIWVICDLPACSMSRRVPAVGQFSPVRWTPDANIAYVDGAAASDIWVQPLDGKPPSQLTHFTDRTIVDFAWSRDGERLAIARASTTNDIVLFKGLRKALAR
jgi:eukaryotic-like serine/threonine-protein kinase